MECYRLTYSPGSIWAQNCHKKTAQKAGSCVDRACRCRRFLVSKTLVRIGWSNSRRRIVPFQRPSTTDSMASIGHGDISFFATGIHIPPRVNPLCGELTNCDGLSCLGDSPAMLNLVHARGLLKGPMDVILKR
jgi:hypothetical protein